MLKVCNPLPKKLAIRAAGQSGIFFSKVCVGGRLQRRGIHRGTKPTPNYSHLEMTYNSSNYKKMKRLLVNLRPIRGSFSWRHDEISWNKNFCKLYKIFLTLVEKQITSFLSSHSWGAKRAHFCLCRWRGNTPWRSQTARFLAPADGSEKSFSGLPICFWRRKGCMGAGEGERGWEESIGWKDYMSWASTVLRGSRSPSESIAPHFSKRRRGIHRGTPRGETGAKGRCDHKAI